MNIAAEVTSAQAEARAHWQAVAQAEVAPFARQIDREAAVPEAVMAALREAGAFASGFPEAFGGPAGAQGDPVGAALAHGALHEALGRASASVQGVLNVHHMGGSALARWGSAAQKAHWGPLLTSGATRCAIAITEPEVGSDATAVRTRAEVDGDGWVVSGEKAWITCGASADLFVLIAASAAGPVALLLPREAPGLSIAPIPDMLGCRGYAMARLILEDVRLPGEALLGKPGFGVSHVAATGLESGRHNLAWGCVGLAEACRQAALSHVQRRAQFGEKIAEFQLVQQLIARMSTEIHAARLMCRSAAVARGQRAMTAAKEATMAKYFASTMVGRVAKDAQQLHGAAGIGPKTPLEMYFRDARIMEVIEGTTQILEVMIARFSYQEGPA
ncbi:MAG: acyl-CoA dehydrogenase [Rhodobacteraceae bacterium]|nr:MAG: acyl-CoA dehydrogenase [Paracoccaceae bacterium]